MEDLIKDAKRTVKNIISTLLVEEPVFGMLLRRTWIYADINTNLAYTEGLSIYINPERFVKLQPIEQRFVLLHELMHIVLKHTLRAKEFEKKYGYILDPLTMNIVADAKANQYLTKYRGKLRLKPVWPEDVEKVYKVSDIEKKSTEELIEELAKKAKKVMICPRSGDSLWPDQPQPPLPPSPVPPDVEVPPRVPVPPSSPQPPQKPQPRPQIPQPDTNMPQDVFREGEGDNKEKGGEGDKGEGDGEDKVKKISSKAKVPLNEGDKEDQDAKTPEELFRSWIRKMAETLIAVKMAGRVPAELERLVESLLRPIIGWKELLRGAVTKGLGRQVKRTWSRPSRKNPDIYPGKETLKLNKVVVLIDTSGSIGQRELERFVSEVYGVLKETSQVIVIPWDAVAYTPIVLKSLGDIKRACRLGGGGGTCIKPALIAVDKAYRDADKIVIFSDWWIADLDDPETQRLLKKYAHKIVAFTTDKNPPEYLESYKIHIAE
jgi:predicted metal-dependent peptidase